MAFCKERKPKFDEKVKYVAEETEGKAIIPRMKGRPRCESKAAFKYTDATGTSWHRCTDIVRATILYDDLTSMYDGLEVLEKLHEAEELEIIEFNDRYQKPMPGNYRDLQLSVKIDSMICELQLNTKVMAYVKEHAGHRNFEVSRELIAAVKESNSNRCDEILRWGEGLLGAESIQEILNEDKKPVLHEAAKTGNADLVSVFLKHGADVNLRSSDGQTALHKAMAGGFERAAWALICAKADFVADEQGITPLMEGLLKLRVNPSDESIARAVSTVAQLCQKSEFEKLAERMEALARSRLIQSSELVVACKDNNFDKVERLLRDWADPNSVADGLHVVHAALHGGQRDFHPDRAKVLGRVLEFRANPDATTSFEDETCTALEVALRSYSPRAPTGIAELVRHGAHFMNRCVRKYLPPWTAKSQETEPQELACHFLNTWPCLPFGGRELLKIDISLMLKGCLPEFLLFHGHEAAKQCDVLEEKKDEVAQLVANLLERRGHQWESTAVRADCRAKEVILSKTFEDASNQIRSVSFSPQFLAAGDEAGKVWIYDLHQDSSLIRTLHDASDWIHSVSWCGQWLAAGGRDQKMRVYNAAQDFFLAKSLEDASDEINSTAWSDQQLLAAAGDDCKIWVYDGAQDFALLATLGDASDRIRALSWGGPLLAAGGTDKKIRVYDGTEEFLLIKILDATSMINSLAWNGPLLASGCDDKNVRIYDAAKDFALIQTLGDAAKVIRSVAWSGHLLAAAGADKQVRLYSASQDFALIQTLGDASDSVTAVSWRGQVLAAAGADKKLRIYHEDQKRPADAQVTDWVRFVELAIDSQGAQSVDALLHAAVACHALAGSLEESLPSAAQAVATKLRAIGRLDSSEELLQKYAVEDFTAIKTMADASGPIRSVSSSRHLLAAACADAKVRIYDVQQEFTAVRVLEEASDYVRAAAWSQNLLATAGYDRTVRIYDSDQDFVVLKTIHDDCRVLSLAWNAHLLGVGGRDKKVWVYDSSKEFALLKIIDDASDEINCVSWGQQLLAAAGDDKTVRIYDVTKDFQMIKGLQDATARIWSLAWSANLLAVGGNDTQLRVYDAGQAHTGDTHGKREALPTRRGVFSGEHDQRCFQNDPWHCLERRSVGSWW